MAYDDSLLAFRVAFSGKPWCGSASSNVLTQTVPFGCEYDATNRPRQEASYFLKYGSMRVKHTSNGQKRYSFCGICLRIFPVQRHMISAKVCHSEAEFQCPYSSVISKVLRRWCRINKDTRFKRQGRPSTLSTWCIRSCRTGGCDLFSDDFSDVIPHLYTSSPQVKV